MQRREHVCEPQEPGLVWRLSAIATVLDATASRPKSAPTYDREMQVVRGVLLVGVLAVLNVVSCRDHGNQCVPGAQSTCACIGGGAGAQVCGPDGTYGACQCAGGLDTTQAGIAALAPTPAAPPPPVMHSVVLRAEGGGAGSIDVHATVGDQSVNDTVLGENRWQSQPMSVANGSQVQLAAQFRAGTDGMNAPGIASDLLYAPVEVRCMILIDGQPIARSAGHGAHAAATCTAVVQGAAPMDNTGAGAPTPTQGGGDCTAYVSESFHLRPYATTESIGPEFPGGYSVRVLGATSVWRGGTRLFQVATPSGATGYMFFLPNEPTGACSFQ